MYLRTKEDALDALSAILALPERRQQIIQMSVKIMACLDPEPRRFLADCLDTLIHDGLDYMRRKRQEAFSELQQNSPTAYVIVDSSRDDLMEQVGSALDALRMAGVALDVFPELRGRIPAWRIARAILLQEANVRDAMVRGVRSQDDPAPHEDALRIIEECAPAWAESAAAIRAICSDAVLTPYRGADLRGLADDDEVLFTVLAVADDRAKLVLDLLAGDRAGALEYVAEVRRRIDFLQELEEKTSR